MGAGEARLLIATGNPGKVREIRALLAGLDIALYCLKDLPLLWGQEDLGGLPRIDLRSEDRGEAVLKKRLAALAEAMEETGTTFRENAGIKAMGAAQFTGLPVLADDSGLEVAALAGAPGILSARYAGPGRDEQACNQLLLDNLQGVAEQKRVACFRAAVAFALPDGTVHFAEGIVPGRIGFAPVGDGGFGYDPLFVLPDQGKTMAELSQEEKNRISHRSQALAGIKPLLEEYFRHPIDKSKEALVK